MGLFDKKECGICGKMVGLLGARKVEDGTICSDCNKKLSPFFNERKRSTVDEIRQQLAYREQNMRDLQNFNPTRTIGSDTKVYVDQAQGRFVVSRRSDFRAENADIINISQVTGVHYDTQEHREEIYRTDSEGNEVSYNPPRFEYSYEIRMTINVNSPYFNEIEFDVTRSAVDRNSQEYMRCMSEANEIVALLGGTPTAPMGANAGMMGAAMGAQWGQQGQFQQPYQQQGQFQQPYQQQGQFQQPYQQQGQFQQQPYQQQGQFQQQPYQQQGRFQQQPYQQGQGQWFCPNCGAPNTGAFCTSCGTKKPN